MTVGIRADLLRAEEDRRDAQACCAAHTRAVVSLRIAAHDSLFAREQTATASASAVEEEVASAAARNGDAGEEVGSDGKRKEWYSKAITCWQSVEASNEGVLGGCGCVNDADVKGSNAFLRPLLAERFGAAKRHLVAMDCAGGGYFDGCCYYLGEPDVSFGINLFSEERSSNWSDEAECDAFKVFDEWPVKDVIWDEEYTLSDVGKSMEHEIDWDPSATETEFLKPHEDLLNGPAYFNGSTLPLPKEKHEETVAASSVDEPNEDYEAVTGFESLDLPEVPKAAIRLASDTPSIPGIVPHLQTSQSATPEFSGPTVLEENPTADAAFKTELKRISIHHDTTGSCFNLKVVALPNGLHGEVRQHHNRDRRSQAIRCLMASGKEHGAISTATASSGDQKQGGLRGKLNKVVLAYSGGLDTSVIVPWLRENYGCEVVCFTTDVAQGAIEMEGLEKKAIASGASQLVVKDLKEEFVSEYIYPCLRAGAVYERKYLLGTSMARPVIAKAMVVVAKEVGADAVAHGCTGKGNDQVLFELTFYALNPELKVVACLEYSLERNTNVADECCGASQDMYSSMMLDASKDDIGPDPERTTNEDEDDKSTILEIWFMCNGILELWELFL